MGAPRFPRSTLILATILALLVMPPSALAAAPSSGANGFAFDLYAQVRLGGGNLFVSPFSVRTALAMTYAGARGETALQMRRALRLDLADEEVHDAFGASLRALEAAAGDGVEVAVANRLWGERTYGFLASFAERIEDAYGAGLERVDFRGDAEAARNTINAWVEAATRDRIADLLPPGAVNADTRLALVNAVYFRGLWVLPFEEARTRDEPFHLADGRSVPAPLMTFGQAERLPFYAGDGLRAIELDYRGGGFSMVIVLPDVPGAPDLLGAPDLPGAPDALAALEARLDEAMLADLLGAMRAQRVEVHLPRFSMTWGTADLTAALAELGMRDAFRPDRADLSGIDGSRDLFVGGVFHQAFVGVDEEGTEAAAATGVVMAVTAALPAAVEVFRADRPFVFLIRHKESGEVLFIGRLADPSVR